MPIPKARRVADLVEQVSSAVAQRTRVDFLKTNDVASELDDELPGLDPPDSAQAIKKTSSRQL